MNMFESISEYDVLNKEMIIDSMYCESLVAYDTDYYCESVSDVLDNIIKKVKAAIDKFIQFITGEKGKQDINKVKENAKKFPNLKIETNFDISKFAKESKKCDQQFKQLSTKKSLKDIDIRNLEESVEKINEIVRVGVKSVTGLAVSWYVLSMFIDTSKIMRGITQSISPFVNTAKEGMKQKSEQNAQKKIDRAANRINKKNFDKPASEKFTDKYGYVKGQDDKNEANSRKYYDLLMKYTVSITKAFSEIVNKGSKNYSQKDIDNANTSIGKAYDQKELYYRNPTSANLRAAEKALTTAKAKTRKAVTPNPSSYSKRVVKKPKQLDETSVD